MKINNETFKERSEKIHKDIIGNPLYDYSKVDVKGANSKVLITCKRCGREFEQNVWHHLKGQGCRICNMDNVKKALSLNNEEFIQRAEAIHDKKYDYSDVIYVNNKSKVVIGCKQCGIKFIQQAHSHLHGKGCPVCAKLLRYKIRKSNKDFIKQAEEKHIDKFGNPMFDYSNTEYKGTLGKIRITCKKCGKEFIQRSSHHLEGCGCPFCKKSGGEKKIEKLLFDNKINYIPQFKFNDCRKIYPLPFDFYLPDYNICIEFDGIHHYEERPGMGGFNRFILQKKNDEIKTDYCKNNKIILFRIRYDENINVEFEKILNFIKNNFQL